MRMAFCIFNTPRNPHMTTTELYNLLNPAVFIEVRARSKKPARPGWQNLTLDAMARDYLDALAGKVDMGQASLEWRWVMPEFTLLTSTLHPELQSSNLLILGAGIHSSAGGDLNADNTSSGLITLRNSEPSICIAVGRRWARLAGWEGNQSC